MTSNQKTDIPPEELFYGEKGEQAEELQELNSVICGGKNVKIFIAGNLKNYYAVWQKNFSDRVIFGIIKNCLKINAKERVGLTSAFEIPHSEQEINIINAEIKKPLAKGAIIQCEQDKDGFISTIFTRQKRFLQNHTKFEASKSLCKLPKFCVLIKLTKASVRYFFSNFYFFIK